MPDLTPEALDELEAFAVEWPKMGGCGDIIHALRAMARHGRELEIRASTLLALIDQARRGLALENVLRRIVEEPCCSVGEEIANAALASLSAAVLGEEPS